MTDAELLEVLGIAPDSTTLFELSRMEPRRLGDQVGLRPATALRAAIELGRRALQARDTRPRLRTAHDVYLHLEPALAAQPRERFHVLCLTTRHTLIADVLVAEGTRFQCMVDPRDVFAPAIAHHAACIVVAHNHPSGDPTPSEPDLVLTSQLVQAGRALSIPVADHIVIGAGEYFSMGQHGLCDLGGGGPPVPMATEHSGVVPSSRRPDGNRT